MSIIHKLTGNDTTKGVDGVGFVKESNRLKKHLYALLFTMMNVLLSFIISYGLLKRTETFSVLLLISVVLFLLIGRRIKSAQIKDLRQKQENYFEKVTIKDKEEFYRPITICYLASLYTFLIYLVVDFM